MLLPSLNRSLSLISTLLGFSSALILPNHDSTTASRPADNVNGSSTRIQSFCVDNEHSPTLSYEDCTRAFMAMDSNPISQRPMVWGSSNPLNPGHLPLRFQDGQCELSLSTISGHSPSSWVLRDYDSPVTALLLECVHSGPRKGGFAPLGPEDHAILAWYTYIPRSYDKNADMDPTDDQGGMQSF